MRYQEGSFKKTPKQAILSIQEEIRRDLEKETQLKLELEQRHSEDDTYVEPERGRSRSRNLETRGTRSKSSAPGSAQITSRDPSLAPGTSRNPSLAPGPPLPQSTVLFQPTASATSLSTPGNNNANFKPVKEPTPGFKNRFFRNKSLNRVGQRPSIEEFISRYSVKPSPCSGPVNPSFSSFSNPEKLNPTSEIRFTTFNDPAPVKKVNTGKRPTDRPADVINQELKQMYLREAEHRRSYITRLGQKKE
ncbi:uncharacterized protein LOC111707479 [Eurytemora carolleeae]|uniref:uncharacterized protein LOC111707479 n=1 Tax=Eurytemora carolleeae TaxID=1294199 RepID=UPI000C763A97|nr:uncharacterized protein LOC111707479 [Eurytemora carolleeae]|eukprot:XP_023336359.1 uncharacterized protein LOC111707479 [Eurytemora affinis]